MATASEDKPKISELKDHVYGMTDVGKQANQYNKTMKVIGQYIGRVYGHEMKKLVLQLEESEPEEPKYPTSNEDKDKSIWSKKYDLYLKCWNCRKEGHVKKDCPDLQQQRSEASNVQVPFWAGGAGH